ncbi:DUF4817 domain-containing protein [Caenorhabditis elegans]|uniref:DUF4817 domain-containing protein n=1 Tax=Caenorhabditis elegans TaxID=6239 RepID=B3WFY9_CAEEL|nr:DUF4817 domain-containing protein [Caenorhabditis elegans]CAQ76473.1 DUF4817 domain-containing protein [Caenorhabditis elegans]|eukprot:NP_001129768.1 Uncharacterized protein CELE_F33E2.10 [Caenorhabditis elegans]
MFANIFCLNALRNRSSTTDALPYEPPVELSNKASQTQIIMINAEKPHEEHPVLGYPRFWPILKTATRWMAHEIVGFNCTENPMAPVPAEDYKLGHELIHFVLKDDSLRGYVIPMNAITVSVAAENFLAGGDSFNFEPIDQEAKGFLTYHLISDRVQATYFNYNGLTYLAGICYLMRSITDEIICDINRPRSFNHIEICRKAFELTWLERRRFPCDDVTHTQESYGVDCHRLRRRVLVGFDETHQKIVHLNFNNRTGEVWKEFCSKCNKMESTTSIFFALKLRLPLVLPPQIPDEILDEANEIVPRIAMADSFSDLESIADSAVAESARAPGELVE